MIYVYLDPSYFYVPIRNSFSGSELQTESNTGGSLNSRVLQFADSSIRGLFFVTQIPQFAVENLQFAVF